MVLFHLGYSNWIWVSICCNSNFVWDIRRSSHKILTRRKRLLLWRRIAFKVFKTWNLQVSYWPSPTEFPKDPTTLANFDSILIVQKKKLFFISDMILVIAYLKLLMKRFLKNVNAHHIFIGVVNMIFVAANHWNAWTISLEN